MTTIKGYLDIDEHSHSVTITCSTPGLIIDRPYQSKIYIPWKNVKSIAIHPFIKDVQKADIKLHQPDPMGYQFQLIWNEELTKRIPDILQISSN